MSAIATDFRYNDRIRISPVRLINDKDEMVGIVPTAEALRMAREAQLDLVEVAPNARPPVCKILDFGKWKYQQQKKEQKSHAHGKGGQLKELKFRTVRIGDHDLEIKINHAKGFLEEGNKVQFTLQFRGRELAHTDLGYKIFNKVRDALFLVSKVERPAKMEGKRMTLVLQPDHKTGRKAEEGPASAAPQSGFSRPAVSGQGLNLPNRTPQPVG
ncbi:MAG: translation initiation factor IF-3 [Tepidisphaeraceae bacterium]